jgi:short-subunit dehydrogenase
VNFPFIAGYSASKAASIELSAKNNPVDIVNPGAIDTDMNKGSTMQTTSPEDVDERVHELFCDRTHGDDAYSRHVCFF